MRNFVHNIKIKTAVLCILTIALTIFTSSCQTAFNEYTGFAMGSVLSARLYGLKKDDADAMWNNISGAAQKADLLLSATVSDSDIAKINRSGSVNANAFTVSVVSEAVTDGNLTGGCVDVSLGAVTALWGFSTDTPRLPSQNEISKALAAAGLSKILIDQETGKISVSDGVKLDLGAVGKGAGCQAIYDVLKTKNFPAVISLGGTVLLYGKNPVKNAWKVGIRNPFQTVNDYFAVLSLTVPDSTNARYISTSGSYEKCFTENGATYHHLLDPKNGYPAENGLVSVTVVAGGGVMSDALSTACFVNGFRESTLLWLKNFAAEAVFIFENGDYYVTDGLKNAFTLTAESGFQEKTDGIPK